jgi:predicted RNase H-like HicB family nuclease
LSWARVAKSVDARDLKSLDGTPSCQFESGPGHQRRCDDRLSPAARGCARTRVRRITGRLSPTEGGRRRGEPRFFTCRLHRADYLDRAGQWSLLASPATPDAEGTTGDGDPVSYLGQGRTSDDPSIPERRPRFPCCRNGAVAVRFLLAVREVEADLHCVMIPDLPGCRAVGRDRQQAIRYARRAIGEHCRMLAHAGEPMPEPLPLEQHSPLPDVFEEATWTSVDVPIEQYFER